MKLKKDIKNILLIMPPSTISKEYSKEIQPPIGLAYIAACLEKDYNVKIIDASCEGWEKEISAPDDMFTYGLTFEDLKEKAAEFKPDIAGVSCLYSMQYKNAHTTCKIIKELNKDIITFMGGAHPTALPKETLEDKNVDFIIIGEGEQTTQELIAAIKTGSDISTIDGIAFRENNNIIINPKTKFIDNLDKIPFPARHLLPMEKYFKINMPHGVSSRFSPNTPLITSRGCPAHCIFCSIHGIWGYRYRARSVNNVMEELRLLKNKYGVREIQFEDDNITLDKNRAMELFERMIKEKLNLSWTTPNGVAMWSMNKELLAKMKQSGCYKLCLAFESGDQEMLTKVIHKPLDLLKTKDLMRWINKFGFETDAFFVVGFPEETPGQLENTFKFAGRLKTDNVSFYIATPYPGTELYNQCQKAGYLPKNFSWESLGVKKVNIYNKYMSTEKIEKLVAYHILKHKFTLIWRNPYSFYKKVLRRYVKAPKHFIALTRKLIRILSQK